MFADAGPAGAGEGGGAPDGDKPGEGDAEHAASVIAKLNAENKKHREKAEAAQRKLDEIEAANIKREEAEKAKQRTVEEQLASMKDSLSQADRRYILAEARATAIAAGLLDPKYIRYFDAADLSIDNNGNVKGLAEKIEAWKADSPVFFRDAKDGDGDGNADDVAPRDAGGRFTRPDPKPKAKPVDASVLDSKAFAELENSLRSARY